jgi:hypothetical protein
LQESVRSRSDGVDSGKAFGRYNQIANGTRALVVVLVGAVDTISSAGTLTRRGRRCRMRHTVACHLLQLSLPLPLGQFLIDDVLATTKQWDMMENAARMDAAHKRPMEPPPKT